MLTAVRSRLERLDAHIRARIQVDPQSDDALAVLARLPVFTDGEEDHVSIVTRRSALQAANLPPGFEGAAGGRPRRCRRLWGRRWR
jgi:hypothetical protein